MWCENYRNIQHRLRHLTFVICKHLTSECVPSIVQVRIPDPDDRIAQYDIDSFIFLNGYIRDVHVTNCQQEKCDLVDLNSSCKRMKRVAEQEEVSQWKVYEHYDLIEQQRSAAMVHKKNREMPQQQKIRDPFMARDLKFELEQICQAFDLLEYGVEMAFFLIQLLNRKQVESLWTALGIVLESMPYEKARFVLTKERENLRHGDPSKLKAVCDKIINGSKFSVHICLFLADYMEKNASQDLARCDAWNAFSTLYEAQAGDTINDIESDHLLSILMVCNFVLCT